MDASYDQKETSLRMKLISRKAEWRNGNTYVLDGFIKLLVVHGALPTSDVFILQVPLNQEFLFLAV